MQKLLLLVGLCVLVAHLEATCSRKLVCTFQSVPDSDVNGINDVDVASDMKRQPCTHIIFKRVRPNKQMKIPSSGGPIQDHQDFKTAFPGATAKTLLEVDLIGISSAIFTLPKRADFITSVFNVVVAEGFDGVNILWMQSGAFDSEAKQGFTDLMKELKAKLDLLTASVSGVPSVIDDSYEVPQLVGIVDCFNVMTADLDRKSPVGTFPNAIDGMDHWVQEGAPTGKLNMGIATYGVDTKPKATARIWPKSQVCAAPLLPATVVIDSDATIDDKATHIVTQNFGGAYVTSLELDDFDGVACAAGPFPVIQRVKDVVCP
ncbi:oviduct-specific glycoprotein-like isoform X1 [Hippocampus comes]|uniref:oviduct-specific glycoprotein-like isoform X1 n=1 Tax=Hippocampus comes TaxID=109280 RepID=UPI00094E50D5|nr:PREDICTED: oviduct-specific glycoprotein-like isoform X1 [Hippocampus comes]